MSYSSGMRKLIFVALAACGESMTMTMPGGDGGPGADGSLPDGSMMQTDGGDTDSDSGAPVIVCNGDCHYVRAGASGQGTSWDDAFPALPATLVRGHVYFIASGNYPKYAFDDPAGAVIRIVRATMTDHGDASGWKPDYAMGTATFGAPLEFKTTDWDFDGRGATTIKGAFQGSVVSITASKVALRGSNLDAAFVATNGKHTGGACTGLELGGDDLVIDGNDIHDAADDGVSLSGSRITFSRNHVHTLHGCGTDGGCGPCYNGHSDGLELYAVKDSTFTSNYVDHAKSTSPVFFGNWADELGMGPADYCQNVTMTNNIFYGPETGFAVYFEDVNGLWFAENVVWGTHQGAYGGLAIGTHVKNLDMIGNVVLSVNYTHLMATYDPQNHRGDYNLFAVALGQWPTQTHDIVNLDPGFTGIPNANGMDVTNAQAKDFTPKMGAPVKGKGTTGMKIPTTDFFGTVRGNPPSIGAIE